MVKTKSEWFDYLKSLILSLDNTIDVDFGTIPDVFINPVSVALTEIDTEQDRLKKILNINNFDLMTDEEFRGILSNYLITPLTGLKATGIVYFQARSLDFDITIPKGTPVSTDISSGRSIVFYTTQTKTMLVAQKPLYFNANSNMFEISVPVECSVPGVVGNVPAGAVKVMLRNITGISSVINRDQFTGGVNAETRIDTIRRLKSFLRSVGALSVRDGILLKVLSYVEDACIVGARDNGFNRDSYDSGAVDVFIIGQRGASVFDLYRVGYFYLENPSTGIVWYFNRQPVLELISVIIDGIDRTSWFELKKDTGIYSGSVRAKDALYIPDPNNLDLYNGLLGKSVVVNYRYNDLVNNLQNIFDDKSINVFGRDLLIREAFRTDVYIKMVIKVLGGYDLSVLFPIIKSRVYDYVNNLNLGDSLEQSDVNFIIRSIPGIDNLVFLDFRKLDELPGTVHDLVPSFNEYFRISDINIVIV